MFIYNEECRKCLFECKDAFNSNCQYIQERVTKSELKELNYERVRQNVDMRKLCRDKRLKYKLLMRMFYGKEPFNYKYLYEVNKRLCEKDWIIEFLEKHPTGLNETNTLCGDSFI